MTKTPDARLLTMAESDALNARHPYEPTWDQCGAVAVSPISGGRYTCTRTAGHAGPHIAHAPKGPIATWDEPHA